MRGAAPEDLRLGRAILPDGRGGAAPLASPLPFVCSDAQRVSHQG